MAKHLHDDDDGGDDDDADADDDGDGDYDDDEGCSRDGLCMGLTSRTASLRFPHPKNLRPK